MTSNPTARSAATRQLPPVPTSTWTLLSAITLLGAVLRGVRLFEPPGGFLVFNEGFYLYSGMTNASRGLFDWFLSPTEVNKPPLFQGIVSHLIRAELPPVASARALSIFAGVASIVLVFLLGRLLFDRRTGLVAAAMLAVMPGVVLVDHNIQTDPLMVALSLAGIYGYALALATRQERPAIIGGLLLGLGILTKEPAVLALPALALWETWRTGSIAWLRERRVRLFGIPALALGSSWYVLQLVTNPTRWVNEMFVGEGALTREGMTGIGMFFWSRTAGELLWMLFPLTATLALVGLVYIGVKRRAGDKLILSLGAVFFAYWMGVHFHSYYLLPLAPVLALAIGRACVGLISERIRAPWLRPALLTTLVAMMSIASVLMLAGHKWGRWSPMEFSVPGADSPARVSVAPELDGFFGPALDLTDDGVEVQRRSAQEYAELVASTPDLGYFMSEQVIASTGRELEPRHVLEETRYRLVLFGYELEHAPADAEATQYFRGSRWSARKVGPLWHFGMRASRVSSGLHLYDRESFFPQGAPQTGPASTGP